MKFVNPSVEILNIPSQNDHDGVLKFIEKIGRICYKSEEKIIIRILELLIIIFIPSSFPNLKTF